MNKIKLGNKLFYYQVFYKNNKNMYLRIKDDILVITCNKRVSIKQVEEFILKNKTNILIKIDNTNKKITLYNKENMLIFGKQYAINYTLLAKKDNYNIYENEININFKKDYFDNKYLEKIYKDLTLMKMNEYYMEEYQLISNLFNIDNITFKTQLMKSRFGSCIPKKRIIKLNSILSRFEEKYIRIILIHELIHLEVYNHQKHFYKYMNQLIPNYKKQIKNLNNLSRKYVI